MLGVHHHPQRSHWGVTCDSEDVRRASELLCIVEIELFRLAYRNWFGRGASEADIECPFMRYLTGGAVPVWVRHLAREVVQEAESGQLDRNRYGLPAIEEEPIQADTLTGCSHLWVTAALLLVAIVSIFNAW